LQATVVVSHIFLKYLQHFFDGIPVTKKIGISSKIALPKLICLKAFYTPNYLLKNAISESISRFCVKGISEITSKFSSSDPPNSNDWFFSKIYITDTQSKFGSGG
jgi:hypothetical protein